MTLTPLPKSFVAVLLGIMPLWTGFSGDYSSFLKTIAAQLHQNDIKNIDWLKRYLRYSG
jgi:hypothetical protein